MENVNIKSWEKVSSPPEEQCFARSDEYALYELRMVRRWQNIKVIFAEKFRPRTFRLGWHLDEERFSENTDLARLQQYHPNFFAEIAENIELHAQHIRDAALLLD